LAADLASRSAAPDTALAWAVTPRSQRDAAADDAAAICQPGQPDAAR
jgi:hypothetical protein